MPSKLIEDYNRSSHAETMDSQKRPNKNIHAGVGRISRGLEDLIDHTERLEYDHLMDNVDQKYKPNEIHEQTRDNIDLPFQSK